MITPRALPGTIDWSAHPDTIIADIAHAPISEPMRAYLMGARIGCLEADLTPPPVDSPSGQPGQIIALDPAGPFWVNTGDGRPLRVSRYQIDV